MRVNKYTEERTGGIDNQNLEKEGNISIIYWNDSGCLIAFYLFTEKIVIIIQFLCCSLFNFI
jgi:hypothetical protein